MSFEVGNTNLNKEWNWSPVREFLNHIYMQSGSLFDGYQSLPEDENINQSKTLPLIGSADFFINRFRLYESSTVEFGSIANDSYSFATGVSIAKEGQREDWTEGFRRMFPGISRCHLRIQLIKPDGSNTIQAKFLLFLIVSDESQDYIAIDLPSGTDEPDEFSPETLEKWDREICKVAQFLMNAN